MTIFPVHSVGVLLFQPCWVLVRKSDCLVLGANLLVILINLVAMPFKYALGLAFIKYKNYLLSEFQIAPCSELCANIVI